MGKFKFKMMPKMNKIEVGNVPDAMRTLPIVYDRVFFAKTVLTVISR